ncbi:MAG TPA: hypothetical protein VGK74_18895 [Symbiobacteriaceae bacterium]
MSTQEELKQHLPAEVARFVIQAFRGLEQENVFDAPGVIGGILRQMRVADSDLIRGHAGRTELLLKKAFARGCLQRIGA